MKKKILVSFLVLVFMFINFYTIVCYAASFTLDEIANAFNTSSSVEEYAGYGTIMKATSEENKLIISVEYSGQTDTCEYTLDGSIVSGQFPQDDVFSIGLASIILIDEIAQLHGYAEGEIMDTLNSEEVLNYTVDNEGLEMKQASDGTVDIKIDIDKKIPLITIENEYIEVSDLESLKEYISGDGSAQRTKGDIVFHKTGYDNEATVFVGEEGELTENTYKSILSILQVMFDSEEVVNYFKENYSSISVGNKEFSGFKIEVNPEKSNMEKVVLGTDDTYKFIRITIDKEVARVAAAGNVEEEQPQEEQEESSNNGLNIGRANTDYRVSTSNGSRDSTEYNGTLPDTGKNAIVVLAIIISIISLIMAGVKIYNYRDIK